MSGGHRRRDDYQALNDVGFDMVDAMKARGRSDADLARDYGVTEFNLTLWLRRQRTLIFLEHASPESMIDLLSSGESAASIARAHGVQLALVERWIREHVPAEHLSEARDNAAEAMFDASLVAIGTAKDEFELAREKAKHGIQRFHAMSTTRRFTDDKQVKVTPGAGVSVSFSFTRKKRETGETDAEPGREPEF